MSAALSSLDIASFDAAIDAIRAAWESGAQITILGDGGVTVGLCGYGGDRLKDLARYVVWANVDGMPIAWAIHFIFGIWRSGRFKGELRKNWSRICRGCAHGIA